MKKQASFAVIAAACAALFAAPALADNAAGGSTQNMHMAAPQKHAKSVKHVRARRPAHAHAVRTSLQCTDYAWQSQDQKDCEAGKLKPPHWR